MDKLYWIWLMALEGIGNQSRNRLIDYFETPEAVFKANHDEYKDICGLTDKRIDMLCQNKDLKFAQKAQRYIERHEIELVTRDDVLFPEKIRNIFNPPTAFFAKGNLSLLDRPLNIGVVGSRKASPSGISQANRLSRELGEMGMTIVSGFATGIDTASHTGALGTIGSTIAVLGSGINVCYPKTNADLYHDMLDKGGLLLTEFFMDSKPLAFHFPLRNRVISGLSEGLLVVEAAGKSGALITAKHAMEQGKNVYAIPRDIQLQQSVGSNRLLKDGAKVVTEAKDILEDFVDVPVDNKKPIQQMNSDGFDGLEANEIQVLNWVSKGYNTIDSLCIVTEMEISMVNATLSMLELKEKVRVNYGTVTIL